MGVTVFFNMSGVVVRLLIFQWICTSTQYRQRYFCRRWFLRASANTEGKAEFQESSKSAYRVTHFRVAYSIDCITFANVTDRHGVEK
ncbi:hypothetical protein DPMN_101090, partial [Dreissena polymorpha]